MKTTPIVAFACFITIAAGHANAQTCTSRVSQISAPFAQPNERTERLAVSGSTIAALSRDTVDGSIDFQRFELSTLLPIGGPREVLRPLGPIEIVDFIALRNEYAVFHQRQGDGRLYMLRLDAGGNPIGEARLAVTQPFLTAPQSFDVATDGASYVIARTDRSLENRGLWLTRIAPSGEIVEDTRVTTLITEQSKVQLERGGSGFLIAWNGGVSQGVEEQIVTAVLDSGVVSPLRVLPSSGRISALGYANGRYIAASTGNSTNRGPAIRFVLITEEGSPAGAERTLVDGRGETLVVHDFANAGGEAGLAYSRIPSLASDEFAQLHLARLDATFAVTSDVLFTVDPSRQFYPMSAPVVAGTNGFFSAVAFSTAGGVDSYLLSRCPFRASIAAPVRGTAGTATTFRVEVSGGLAPYTIRWELDDNTNALGNPVTRTFSNPGSYRFRVIVTDSSGERVVIEDVAVIAAAAAAPTPARRRTRR
jgi:hypothetical protein